jgi:hypothetical protein
MAHIKDDSIYPSLIIDERFMDFDCSTGFKIAYMLQRGALSPPSKMGARDEFKTATAEVNVLSCSLAETQD